VKKMRIDQDALHQASSTKIDQVRATKKECEWTCKVLPKYLVGHLFKIRQRRVERHLKACSICRSEYDSLRYAADTRQLLTDISPTDGMSAKLRQGFAFMGKVRALLYRPLWVALGTCIVVFVYFFVIVPSRHDPELESIERSLPPATVSAPISSLKTTAPVLATAPAPTVPSPVVKALPPVAPFEITITINNPASIQQINEMLTGFARLEKLRFSATVREGSGSLTANELQALFSRMRQAGRLHYSKKKFKSLSQSDLVPFTMKLTDALPAAVKPAHAAPVSALSPSSAPASVLVPASAPARAPAPTPAPAPALAPSSAPTSAPTSASTATAKAPEKPVSLPSSSVKP